MRCSQLSKTKSVFLGLRCSRSISVSERPGASRTSSAEATACGTRSGSESEANSTSHSPSSNPSTRSLATSSASRVLPQPPGPVSVSKRVAASSFLTSVISCSRPTKLVSWSGRLLEGRCEVRTRGAGTRGSGSSPRSTRSRALSEERGASDIGVPLPGLCAADGAGGEKSLYVGRGVSQGSLPTMPPLDYSDRCLPTILLQVSLALRKSAVRVAFGVERRPVHPPLARVRGRNGRGPLQAQAGLQTRRRNRDRRQLLGHQRLRVNGARTTDKKAEELGLPVSGRLVPAAVAGANSSVMGHPQILAADIGL